MSAVIAIIPARSGSKRVRDKNIRLFAGKPLLAHSIEHAKSSSRINRVIVSTDSEEYANIARAAGAEVPFMRPAALAGDHSTDVDVFLHTLEWLKKNEGSMPEICVHLRPTCPIRRSSDIDAIVDILRERSDIDSVRSVVPAPHTPFKMWFMSKDHLLTPVVTSSIVDAHNLPRQLLPETYFQNACIDAVRSSVLLEQLSMTGKRIYGYRMETLVDIDTEEEYRRAEILAGPAIGGVTKRTFCFDIDGVIADIVPDNDYARCQPLEEGIDLIRKLHAAAHRIVLWTARGTLTGKDWRAVTEKQLRAWNVPYDELSFGKPAADFYIDDRAVTLESLRQFFP